MASGVLYGMYNTIRHDFQRSPACADLNPPPNTCSLCRPHTGGRDHDGYPRGAAGRQLECRRASAVARDPRRHRPPRPSRRLARRALPRRADNTNLRRSPRAFPLPLSPVGAGAHSRRLGIRLLSHGRDLHVWRSDDAPRRRAYSRDAADGQCVASAAARARDFLRARRDDFCRLSRLRHDQFYARLLRARHDVDLEQHADLDSASCRCLRHVAAGVAGAGPPHSGALGLPLENPDFKPASGME